MASCDNQDLGKSLSCLQKVMCLLCTTMWVQSVLRALTEILEAMTTQVQVHAVSLKTCCMTYTQKQ